MRLSVNIDLLGRAIASLGKNYVTPKDISEIIGVSTRTAGKILKALETRGYVVRYSNKAYRVIRDYDSLRGSEYHPPTIVVRHPEDPPLPY